MRKISVTSDRDPKERVIDPTLDGPCAGATPGPWQRTGLFGTKIMSADGLTEICDTYPSGPADQTSEEEAVANAKLIVAALKLYEALKEAKATLGEAAKVLARDFPSFANNVVNQCAIRCEDALAKARGE